MRAVVVDAVRSQPEVREVPDPSVPAGGVVVRVLATGVCRSDWHAWAGHDDIAFPHVPGHELAGEVVEVGDGVGKWRVGDRVTVPFVCGCGRCAWCRQGDAQVCPDQHQPGFTHWGSFAELVALHAADTNLVAVPDSIEMGTAASLGCRFATAYRALVERARVEPGEWVTVVGSGGVGLSAVMIAKAVGARVVAVDRNPEALAVAARLGADHTVLADGVDVPAAVADLTGGGATSRSTRSGASRPAPTRSSPSGAAAGSPRSGCSRRSTATHGSRWRASSAGSSTCSAATGWPPRTTPR